MRLQRDISKVVGCTPSHKNPGHLCHSVTFALIRMDKIAHIRIEEEYTYVYLCYLYVYLCMYVCNVLVGIDLKLGEV